LIVSTNHPWAKTLSETSSRYSSLQVFTKPDTLIGHHVNVRASGYYTSIYEQPIRNVGDYNRAQVITKDDFSWLLKYNLMNCVFELLQMHSDCNKRSIITFYISKSGCVSLSDIEGKSFNPSTDLVKAPGGTIRYLAFLLRGLGIRVTIELTSTPRMRFHVMEDADLLACSHGEVTTPKALDNKTGRPFQGGLFCERIFGPTKDWECSCGKYKGVKYLTTVCDECGVEVTTASVRRERMGHIELAVPVINPLYLDHVCNVLSDILNLKVNEIKSLIYYSNYIIFKEYNNKKMFSFIKNNTVLFSRKEQINRENGPISGALAIQKLLEYYVSSSEAIQYHLLPESVIMKKVLVVPPSLRPNTPLNGYYRKVIQENNRLARYGSGIYPWTSALQEAIDKLFLKDSSLPQATYSGNLRSLIEAVTPLHYECSTLLDMLLARPLDYTAQTRITAEHTGDIDLAFLPETLAYELFRPFIDATTFDCSKFAILVSVDSSFSRFIALRFQLTHDLTLKVHSGLMDLLGWELLGKSARILALFSNEAIEEALSTLAPSRLLQQKSPTIVSNSVLDVAKEDIISFVSTKALLQESVPIGPYEWLLTIPVRYPEQGFSQKVRKTHV